MVSSAPLPWTLRRHTSRPQLKSSFDLKGKTRPLARPSTLNRSARSEVSSSPFRSSTGSLWFRNPPLTAGAATPPFTSADASPWMSMPFGAPPPPLRQRRRQRPHIGPDGETGRLRNAGGDRARGGGKRRGGGRRSKMEGERSGEEKGTKERPKEGGAGGGKEWRITRWDTRA